MVGAVFALTLGKRRGWPQALALTFRGVVLSVAFTGLLVLALQDRLPAGYPRHQLTIAVAFSIAAIGDGWRRLLDVETWQRLGAIAREIRNVVFGGRP